MCINVLITQTSLSLFRKITRVKLRRNLNSIDILLDYLFTPIRNRPMYFTKTYLISVQCGSI